MLLRAHVFSNIFKYICLFIKEIFNTVRTFHIENSAKQYILTLMMYFKQDGKQKSFVFKTFFLYIRINDAPS